jgi:hypothetical protein
VDIIESTQSVSGKPEDDELHLICGGYSGEKRANADTEPSPDNRPVKDEPEDTENHSSDLVWMESEKDEYVLVSARTRRKQLASGPVLCLAVFFTLHVTSNNWTLTTARAFLASLGDDEQDNKYLSIFTLLMPASLLGLPFVDVVIHKFGFHWAFQGVNLLSLGYTVVRLASDNLNTQIVGFIIFSFFRCFLFSVTFSYLPTVVSGDLVGLACGILVMLPGIAAFLNIPLATAIVERRDGDFFLANLLYTLLVVPCVLAAFGIGRSIQREERAKKKSIGTQPDESTTGS